MQEEQAASRKTRVTPFAGVWIEILKEIVMNVYREVTPFAGVWIEIL